MGSHQEEGGTGTTYQKKLNEICRRIKKKKKRVPFYLQTDGSPFFQECQGQGRMLSSPGNQHHFPAPCSHRTLVRFLGLGACQEHPGAPGKGPRLVLCLLRTVLCGIPPRGPVSYWVSKE